MMLLAKIVFVLVSVVVGVWGALTVVGGTARGDRFYLVLCYVFVGVGLFHSVMTFAKWIFP